jgi:hypothetical protein
MSPRILNVEFEILQRSRDWFALRKITLLFQGLTGLSQRSLDTYCIASDLECQLTNCASTNMV